MAPITKRPYLKRQKESPTLVPVPQAAAPVPVHLIAVNKAVSSSSQRMTNHITLAVARAPVEKKSPHVLPAAPAPAPAPVAAAASEDSSTGGGAKKIVKKVVKRVVESVGERVMKNVVKRVAERVVKRVGKTAVKGVVKSVVK